MDRTASSTVGDGDLSTAMLEFMQEASQDPESIDKSICLARDMLANVSDDVNVPPAFYAGLSRLYFTSYKQRLETHDTEFLQTAVYAMAQAEEATSSDDPCKALYLSETSNQLRQLYQETEEISDLNLAIAKAGKAVTSFPDHPASYQFVHDLGVLHELRYKSAPDDVCQLILWAKEGLSEIPDNHPSKARHLLCLSSFLGKRFMKSEMVDLLDLNQGIAHASQAVDIARRVVDPQHPDQFAFMENLIYWLRKRFDILPSEDDLKELINWRERELRSGFAKSPDQESVIINDLGVLWLWRHKMSQSEVPNHIDQAICCFRKAEKSVGHRSADRMDYLNNLVSALRIRFESFGTYLDENTESHPDLDEAISIGHAALEEMPEHALRLKTLSAALGRRYQQFGSPKDIDEAIKLGQLELDAWTSGSDEDDSVESAAACLNNQANFFGWRFERLEDSHDINEAIRLSKRSVQATKDRHHERGSRTNNLGKWFGLRYSKTTDLLDLTSAISNAKAAVAATAPKHPQRPQHLNNLAIWLGWRYERLRADRGEGVNDFGQEVEGSEVREDLDDAIKFLNEALHETPDHHTDRVRYLNNLGKFLTWRYRDFKDDNDITSAIKYGSQAVNKTHLQHPERARHLSNLADMYRLRHVNKKNVVDSQSVIDILKEILNLKSAPPTHRVSAVLEATSWLESTRNWSDLSDVTATAVRLLPRTSARALSQTDQQDILRRYAGLTSLAVASGLQAKKPHLDVVRLLEGGRGIILGLHFDTRSDLSDLKATKYSHLATDFEKLRDELDAPEFVPTFSTESSFARSSQLHSASWKLEEKIEEIRKLEGFETFLESPSTGDLMTAAGSKGSIVVINISFRCDAFIIQKKDIRLCHLRPNLRSELERELRGFDPRHKSISGTMEWLWDAIASPILKELQINEACEDDNWPSVCWIPTGPLCSLPLHAAGYHFDGSRRTVLDRVVSSSSPSVKSLLYTQKNVAGQKRDVGPERAVLISMPTTLGFRDLPFSGTETALLRGILLRSSVSCDLISPERDSVLNALPGCEFFHFAGHGVADGINPAKSGIILKDGLKLTVEDLNRMKLHRNPPFLAYLSACSTGRNRDETLQDEAIHLMGACQLAGFRHTIGSLWEVSDRKCVSIAQTVYETILSNNISDKSVAAGLHMAVRRLRDQMNYLRDVRDGEIVSDGEQEGFGIGGSNLWGAYIHVGFV